MQVSPTGRLAREIFPWGPRATSNYYFCEVIFSSSVICGGKGTVGKYHKRQNLSSFVRLGLKNPTPALNRRRKKPKASAPQHHALARNQIHRHLSPQMALSRLSISKILRSQISAIAIAIASVSSLFPFPQCHNLLQMPLHRFFFFF